MTTPTTTALSPDEWKALCLTNISQLHGYINSLPSLAQDGSAGITDQHLALIDAHLNRGRAFLNAWRRSRAQGTVAQPEAGAAAKADEVPPANGAMPEKRRGGWPRGKSRKAAVPTVTQ